jgi:hypothetical protein
MKWVLGRKEKWKEKEEDDDDGNEEEEGRGGKSFEAPGCLERGGFLNRWEW